MMTGDIDRLLSISPPSVVAGADDGIRVIGLGFAGRRDEARRYLENMREASRIPTFRSWIVGLEAWLDRRPADLLATMASLGPLKIKDDPEAIFQTGWLLSELGEHEQGLVYLRRAVDKGYFVVPTLAGSRHFDAVRGDRAFQEILAEAEAGRDRALAAFRDAGGERLVGQ
jgi:hypothetical protein